MASEPKDYTIFIWMILTSNTEATENKVQFLYVIYIPDFALSTPNTVSLATLARQQTNFPVIQLC